MTLKLPLTITLYGQLPSGKNGMGITTEGKRYPRKRFAAWRTEALAQLPRGLRAWSTPVCLIVDYVPGDRRIRDRSGMLDAIFHLLERGRIITNDGLIEDLEWHTFPIDRERPMARLTIVDADEWRRFLKKTQQHWETRTPAQYVADWYTHVRPTTASCRFCATSSIGGGEHART